MSSPQKLVETAAELSAACKDTGARYIVVRGNILDTPALRLGPSQTLAGEGDDAAISFTPGVDGLQLSSDNDVRSLRLIASVDKRAIFNDTAVESLGCIRLQGLAVHGQVQILARDNVRSGHVDVDGLDVIAADARAQSDRPSGFGVKVIQGAFTLWNMQADESIVISADLKGLSAGRTVSPDEPPPPKDRPPHLGLEEMKKEESNDKHREPEYLADHQGHLSYIRRSTSELLRCFQSQLKSSQTSRARFGTWQTNGDSEYESSTRMSALEKS
jgi:hypothetical protein